MLDLLQQDTPPWKRHLKDREKKDTDPTSPTKTSQKEYKFPAEQKSPVKSVEKKAPANKVEQKPRVKSVEIKLPPKEVEQKAPVRSKPPVEDKPPVKPTKTPG